MSHWAQPCPWYSKKKIIYTSYTCSMLQKMKTLTKKFFRRTFKTLVFLSKVKYPIVTPPSPGDHDLNKLQSST